MARVAMSSGGSVQQDRHLWESRRTAVPYAQYGLTIPPTWRNCQEIFQPSLGPVLPPRTQDTQNTHRTMLASCWRLARGSAGVP
jgi:hypothetical protein